MSVAAVASLLVIDNAQTVPAALVLGSLSKYATMLSNPVERHDTSVEFE
jgi:hypothetical protein